MILYRVFALLVAALFVVLGVVQIVSPSYMEKILKQNRAAADFVPRMEGGLGCIIGVGFVAMGLLLACGGLFGKIIVK